MSKDVTVRMRRVYDAVDPDDGARALVDRLWPRGLAKDAARLDEWCKGVAPSNELRKWYGHRVEAYEEFAERYRAELSGEPGSSALERLRELAADGPLTLLTATKELELSHAAVLLNLLREGA
ncbi:DUF488 domain-containing protein [Streptomyces violens]|uniref:DUF488 domain-containing protein n=1 Tax=Streptomyces violens TaxID=66377 RepID=UPI0004C01B56|nr:DUF488 family protein [Streptomyces violens]